ncbi:MAG: sigma-54-dependent Fis family transcriptional regulator [Bacteroidales bacterium]|nr:sigma-54-dependent Fis family transcriptional regulator [Bacteroidales bacterium]
MKKILIIDDDPYICDLLVKYLARNNFETQGAHKGKEAVELIIKKDFDLILCDYRLPDMDGMEVLKQAKSKNEHLPVIIMTAYAEIATAVKAIKAGAFDYVTKPIQHEEILKTIEKAMAGKTSKESQSTFNKKFITGRSKRIREVLNHVQAVAPTDLSVLIQGETGSGKEFIARAIHYKSKRKDKPFIAVDCGVIPKELANSELFGHVKGAFTGAIKDKTGFFQQASGGTLFLDEVGNLPYENQVKLLRALQERVINKVGNNKKIKIDVRVITASNDDLLNEVKNNNFREDLYHRINGFKINLPALRERKEDIMEFTRRFISSANKEFDKNVEGLDASVEDIFMNYAWYGNIRELENVVKRCVLLSREPLITSDLLPEEILQYKMMEKRPGGNHRSGDAVFELKEATLEAEKEVITNALIKTNFNKSKAARLLNIDRKTLYNKIKEYNISVIK